MPLDDLLATAEAQIADPDDPVEEDEILAVLHRLQQFDPVGVASRDLAEICRIWGLGLSMHSNSHLGISLAAMTHLAAATPNLTYDCDTHQPWQTDEVIEGGKLPIVNGAVALPEGPGLGVTLDRAELKRLNANFEALEYRTRDDATEMRKHWPDWQYGRPKF